MGSSTRIPLTAGALELGNSLSEAEAAFYGVSAARLLDDLGAMDRLHRVGNACIRPGIGRREALEETLDTAMALVSAFKGNIQLLDRPSGSLKIVVQRGFGAAFLAFFDAVRAGESSACGCALECGERVIIEDVSTHALLSGSEARAVLLEEGVRAVQSTPLLSSTGQVLGMISTHFDRPHRPSEREVRFVDLLARLTADYLERKDGEQALRASEARLADQKMALELAMSGAPLPSILRLIARSAQNQLGEQVRCVIYLPSADGRHLRCAASTGMPVSFTSAIESVEIGPAGTAAGRAAFSGRDVIIGDVEQDPYWRAHSALAVEHELGSTWAHPLHTEGGRLLAVLAVYHRTARAATPTDLDALRVLGHTAALIIEREERVEERRRAQAAVRLRTAQFEALLSEAPLGVFLLDGELRIQEANPTACAAFGFPDLVGRDFSELIHELWPRESADEFVSVVRQTLATGEPFFTAERSARPFARSSEAYYEGRINRIPLSDGRLGVVCYFRDITQHIETRKRLEAADRQKNEFLAMLAHELRNPLAPIRAVGDLLARSTGGDESIARITSILGRQVEHLTRLVDDLLDVSRITQGRIELRREPVYLSQIIAQSIETVDGLLKEKRHRLTVHDAREPLRVMGDPARLVQCLVNMLTNAAKYTAPEGDIRIEARASGEEALILVSDNGPGIAPELLGHIFDLFVQSERTLDRSQGGLGIGLSVVRRLIEMHGGRVAVRSAGVGLGSSFEIRLPLYGGVEVPARDSASVPIRPQRILIVDDNADAAHSLGMLLELKGHRVESVYTSREALERVEALDPEIVLLDIGLPDLDGYEVARRLRAARPSASMRLIAVTGYGRQEDRDQARSAGFDDHLVKPVDFEQLERVLSISTGASAVNAPP